MWYELPQPAGLNCFNLGTANLIRRQGATIEAQYDAIGPWPFYTLPSERAAKDKMAVLCSCLGGFNFDAIPPQNANNTFPWLLYQPPFWPDQQFLIQLCRWHRFERQPNGPTFNVVGFRDQGPGGLLMISANITEGEAQGLLTSLRTCTGSGPLP